MSREFSLDEAQHRGAQDLRRAAGSTTWRRCRCRGEAKRGLALLRGGLLVRWRMVQRFDWGALVSARSSDYGDGRNLQILRGCSVFGGQS